MSLKLEKCHDCGGTEKLLKAKRNNAHVTVCAKCFDTGNANAAAREKQEREICCAVLEVKSVEFLSRPRLYQGVATMYDRFCKAVNEINAVMLELYMVAPEHAIFKKLEPAARENLEKIRAERLLLGLQCK